MRLARLSDAAVVSAGIAAVSETAVLSSSVMAPTVSLTVLSGSGRAPTAAVSAGRSSGWLAATAGSEGSAAMDSGCMTSVAPTTESGFAERENAPTERAHSSTNVMIYR